MKVLVKRAKSARDKIITQLTQPTKQWGKENADLRVQKNLHPAGFQDILKIGQV